MKKGSWAQDGQKPLRKRGLKVQSPILAAGVIPGLSKKKFKKKDAMLAKKKRFYFKTLQGITKSSNPDSHGDPFTGKLKRLFLRGMTLADSHWYPYR